MVISNHLFLNDTLIFCNVNSIQLCYLRCILICSKAVLGLRINLSKFENVPIGEVMNVKELAINFGLHVSSILMKYFCLWDLTSRHICDFIIDKMHNRLTSQKKLYLSKGGRLFLIKSTLSSHPTYFLYLFPLSVRVTKRLNKKFKGIFFRVG